ncbi:MAG: class I SAM-dependent methyltransferase [Sterolibacterium sp.]
MAHHQQLQFIKTVSQHLTNDYANRMVLEIGSYDVNGSIRPYFEKSTYVGVDLKAGPGVDVVSEGNKLDHPDETYDLTVSCECFEHNPQWSETFLNMHRMTKAGGVVIFTCATTGRVEHGTTRTRPKESPGTQSVGWDYYLNLTENDFKKAVDLSNLFSSYFFLTNRHECDLYFVGEKIGGEKIFRFDALALRSECIAVAIQQQGVASIESGYPRPLRLLYRLSLLPVRLASVLPDRQFQNFAVYYCKMLDLIKIPIKYAIGKVVE